MNSLSMTHRPPAKASLRSIPSCGYKATPLFQLLIIFFSIPWAADLQADEVVVAEFKTAAPAAWDAFKVQLVPINKYTITQKTVGEVRGRKIDESLTGQIYREGERCVFERILAGRPTEGLPPGKKKLTESVVAYGVNTDYSFEILQDAETGEWSIVRVTKDAIAGLSAAPDFRYGNVHLPGSPIPVFELNPARGLAKVVDGRRLEGEGNANLVEIEFAFDSEKEYRSDDTIGKPVYPLEPIKACKVVFDTARFWLPIRGELGCV